MTRAFFRMPLGYGPTPGPRQDAQGQPLDNWDNVQIRTCTVTFEAPAEQLGSFLPRPCFQINPDKIKNGLGQASIIFSSMDKLPWLAGRGYNLCGLYIHNVQCQGKTEKVEAKYLSVLFEDFADPLLSGREELGYPKVFASLDQEYDEAEGAWSLRIGWQGAQFGEMRLRGLQSRADMDASTGAGISRDVLCYKYIPRTGSPGESDVEYPTLSPAPPPSAFRASREWEATDASFQFTALGFQQLPTLHHIAEKLAAITVVHVVGGSFVEGLGAPDFQSQRAISI
ncbi:hypothetical protein F66182_4155 [Fusarium sp. NRRL 66182]|nr:hypothetical protein F66182_4155 [Fusarium sp. NRRL 66182]